VPALTGPAMAAGLLLAIAGALKVADPKMTVGALRALRVPATPALVRAGAGAELLIGMLAVTYGSAAVWWLVAASYGAFAVFVIVAMRAGTMVGSCGCFGREDTPPHTVHVVLDAALAGVAVATALRGAGAPLAAVLEDPGVGAVVVGLVCVMLYVLHAAFVDLPRLLVDARSAARAPAIVSAAGSDVTRRREAMR
jgi:hypothetical protein